jgi:hypothetical protein
VSVIMTSHTPPAWFHTLCAAPSVTIATRRPAL